MKASRTVMLIYRHQFGDTNKKLIHFSEAPNKIFLAYHYELTICSVENVRRPIYGNV